MSERYSLKSLDVLGHIEVEAIEKEQDECTRYLRYGICLGGFNHMQMERGITQLAVMMCFQKATNGQHSIDFSTCSDVIMASDSQCLNCIYENINT